MVTSVPTMLALVMREPEELAKADRSLRHRRRPGSAPSTPVNRAHAWPSPMPRRPTAGARRVRSARLRPRIRRGLPSHGRRPSLENIEVKFVGGDANQGVLHIRTPALMSGYLNREAYEEAPDPRLVRHRRRDASRRYGPRFSSACLAPNDMFQCGGENVYPGEVEKSARDVIPTSPRPASCRCPSDEVPVFPWPLRRSAAPARSRPRNGLRRFAPDNAPCLRPSRAGPVRSDELPLAGTYSIRSRTRQQRLGLLSGSSVSAD